MRVVAEFVVVLVDLVVTHCSPLAAAYQPPLMIDVVSNGQTFLVVGWTNRILADDRLLRHPTFVS
jgi:hypothetical protein